jgi:hypothetical protein
VATDAEGGKLLAADGKADGRLDLAKAAGLAEAFGLVAPGSRLAGSAAFAGNAASQGRTVVGSGALSATNLDVHLADTDTKISEPRLEVPVEATYFLDSGQVRATLAKITSRLASGDVKATLTPGQDRVTVDAGADLALDGASVRAALGNLLPPELTLADAWHLTAQAAGPVPTGDMPMARRAAGLTGAGVVKVGTFTYRDTVGSEGEIRWELGGGKLLLGPDKERPSQVAINEGTLRLGGEVDLKEDPPRYRVREPLPLATNVRLTGELAEKTLIYMSPVVGYSATPTGRLTMVIDRADVPLGSASASETGLLQGRFTVEDFRTRLKGPFALLMQYLGESGEIVEQVLGPIPIRFEQGLFHLQNQTVYVRQGLPLRLDGTIRAKDGALNLMVMVPLTETLLKKAGIPVRADWMITDKFVRVPMTGTVKEPRFDDKRLLEAVVESIKDIFKPAGKPLEGFGKILEGIFAKPEKKPPAPPPENPPP